MTDAAIIAEWPLNRGECVRISIDRYQGNWIVNARKWFKVNDGSWRPGKQGIAIAVRHLPTLVNAMTLALAEAQKRAARDRRAESRRRRQFTSQIGRASFKRRVAEGPECA